MYLRPKLPEKFSAFLPVVKMTVRSTLPRKLVIGQYAPLLALALLAAVPLWTGPGILNTRGGGDSPFLFFRLHQLLANLRDGVFPARWMPDAAYGLGYPFFNYYAALPYYFAALFNFLGFDLLVSIKIVQTLGFVLAAFAMYGWARRHFTARSAGWLAAVAYLYAPFHLVNVYVRGDSLSEFYAFIFYPLILWSIDRIFDSPRNFPLLALSYGGLILTHNVSALIFSPFVVLYTLIYLAQSTIRNQKSAILSVALGLFFAFALSAFFWLPALGEAHLVQLDVQTTGYFNYAEHFRSTHLIQNSIGFDYSIAATPELNTPFAVGLLQALATIAGVIAMLVTWRRTTNHAFRLFVLLGLALSTFMIMPLSKGLWDNLPLLPLAQFPWRFLSIQALFASLAIGFLASRPLRSAPMGLPLASRPLRHISGGSLLASLVGMGLVASMLFTLHPDYLPIHADEITPDRLQLYEAFTSNIGTTIRAEYLPRTMIPRPYTGPDLIDPFASTRSIVSTTAITTLVERHATRQEWKASVISDTATLNFPITYWPGWHAFVDGQEVAARPAPDLGYVQIDAPHGEHRVVLKLNNTPIRTIGELVSLGALLMLLVVAGLGLKKSRAKASSRAIQTRLTLWPTGLVALAIIALAILFAIATQSIYALPPNLNDLTMDFSDKPWLHHNLGGVNFGAARLKSYDLEQQPDRIGLTSEWEIASGADVTATIALVAPSAHLFDGPDPLVEQIVDIVAGVNHVELTPPYQPASSLYYVRVQVGDRIEYLAPVWMTSASHVPTSHVFGQLTPAIGLDSAQTQLQNLHRLDVRLQWAITGGVDANYGLSLRLHDDDGKAWTSLDTQPGYGFQPTSAWQIGAFNDAYTLNLPDDLPRDQVYALDVILYRVDSRQEVGRTTIDNLRVDQLHAWQPVEPSARNFSAPQMPHSLDATFDDQIQLLGYDLKHEGETLKIDLAWKALRDTDQNYKVFAHVFDPVTEQIVAQWDTMPRNNAYSTSRWLKNEVVTETLSIPLTGVPAGEYRVAIGLYESAGRLPVSGAVGIDAANQRVILEEKVAR